MSFSNSQRLIWTAIIVVVLSVTVGPISKKLQLDKNVFSQVDSSATKYVDAGLERAGIAFVTARAFNATVSVFQESELQLEPGGVGVSLALGQALDPVNDLVERFSWVMLASLTSLGIQKFLIEITPFVSIQIVLLLSLLSFLVGLWLPMAARDNFRSLGEILLISAIIIRFAIPTMAYLNNQVYDAFLQESHDESMAALGQTVSKLKSHQEDALVEMEEASQGETDPVEKKRWWNRGKEVITLAIGQAKNMVNIKQKIEEIKSTTLGLVDKVVNLIVVFALTTIVLPLLFLWGIFKLGQLVIGRGLDFVSIDRLERNNAPAGG